MLGKDLVRPCATCEPYVWARLPKCWRRSFKKNQWHVAQFLLHDGGMWCKHELFAAWSGALSKTELTTRRLRFPFGVSSDLFFPSLTRFAALEVRGGPVSDEPPRCLCHVPLGNSLRWFPWKWFEFELVFEFNQSLLGGKKKVWSWWWAPSLAQYCNQSVALQRDLLHKVNGRKPLARNNI